MKSYGILSLFLTLIIFSACAVPYQKQDKNGGYTDILRKDGYYSVRFLGNDYNTIEELEDFCLLRCAEIADEKEMSYIFISEKSFSYLPVMTKYIGTRGMGENREVVVKAVNLDTKNPLPGYIIKMKLYSDELDREGLLSAPNIIDSMYAKYDF